jgi:hypothetical protein
MKTTLILINILSLVTILFWALYKAHISERLINRFSYILIAVATTIIVIIAHLDSNENKLFYENYDWQRLIFVGSIAFRCFVDFYCEYGSTKWKEAFVNSKNRILHLTH